MENRLKCKQRKNLKKDSYENLLDGVKIWTEYFRKNPHRFCMDWLGINLYWFQQVLLYMMNICTSFCFTASRGLGKTAVPTFVVVMGSCVFRIIWIYTIFAYFHTIQSLYILYVFSWGITAIAENIYFFHVYRHTLTEKKELC